jgi:DNA processing protein
LKKERKTLNELEALAILSQLPHLGSVKIRALVEHFGSAQKTLDADAAEIEALPGFGPKIISHWKSWEKDGSWQEDLELAERHRIQLIPFRSPNYPQRLLDLHDAPILLYVKGEIKAQDQQSIAVVGTRNASRYGLEMAEKIASGLTLRGFTVISGLARGIDTAAHMHALPHGRTLAVIGSGLLDVYPRENLKLAEQISQKGALISEFRMRTPPDRQNFPQRNRIVSGMTLGTVLIEAPVESGAMITMQKAFSQGRKLFALPGRADSESFQGNHRLIKSGEAQLVENAEDVVDCFRDLLRNSKKNPVFSKEMVFLEKEEQKFLEQIPSRELSYDEIAGLTKLNAMQLNIILMGLVLKKAIKEYPGKIYKKVV